MTEEIRHLGELVLDLDLKTLDVKGVNVSGVLSTGTCQDR